MDAGFQKILEKQFCFLLYQVMCFSTCRYGETMDIQAATTKQTAEFYKVIPQYTVVLCFQMEYSICFGCISV